MAVRQNFETVADSASTEPAIDVDYFEDKLLTDRALANPDALDALIKEYIGFIRLKASNYFLQGGENEDLVQEGMIGFYKGVRDYDGEKASFRSFAELCVNRQIITAVKAATRQKHAPMNNYMSLEAPAGDGIDGDVVLGDVLPDSRNNPEEQVIADEIFDELMEYLQLGLSYQEYICLKMQLEGATYKEIAEELCTDEKSVDNAMQRVQRKVGELLEYRQ